MGIDCPGAGADPWAEGGEGESCGNGMEAGDGDCLPVDLALPFFVWEEDLEDFSPSEPFFFFLSGATEREEREDFFFGRTDGVLSWQGEKPEKEPSEREDLLEATSEEATSF